MENREEFSLTDSLRMQPVGISAAAAVLPSWVVRANEESQLAVHEIYHSLQGETSFVGRPCVLVRLTGCVLRCRWCDTRHAYEDGHAMTAAAILTHVRSFDCPLVVVTGGEPLAQAPTLPLLTDLADQGFCVLLETSGALSLAGLDSRVHCILDIKPPGSGMSDRMYSENRKLLRAHDEVKFVLADRTDYEWAKTLLRRERLAERCQILFSPVWPLQDPAMLAQWILEDRLPVRFQLPLHRVLWGSDCRGR